ncbi:MAG: cohesin domain-containing protein, partial [Bacteroidota bacterium]
MKRGLLLCGTLLCTFLVWSQTLTLQLPEVTVADDATVDLPLTVQGFDSIVSVQLSINWDTEVATYQSFELGALPLLAIGDFQAADGELRLSWFDNTGEGRTLADGTVIATLSFQAMGSPGSTTPLNFTGEPLAIQIFKATGVPGQFDPVDFSPDDGRITIEAPLGFTIAINDVSCFGNDDGSAVITLGVDPDDYTINWSGPNGFTATGLAQSELAAGTYDINITDQSGATVFTSELTINGPDNPLTWVSIDSTNTDCNTPNGLILAEATGGTPPLAYTLNNQMNTTGDFINLGAGVYQLQVTDANGCTLAETVNIVAPGAPVLSLPAEISLCEDALVLAPGGSGTFAWSTGESTATITVNSMGTYGVTVTNADGCSAEAST